jgi:L-rhamnose-H+ transport protein
MTLGFLLLLTAGIMNGSFAAPMKRMKGWQWEHCWLMWAIAGLVVVPLAAVLFTVARPFIQTLAIKRSMLEEIFNNIMHLEAQNIPRYRK